MQTPPKENEISQELLDSYEYQVLKKSIDDLVSVLVVIQEGINAEFSQFYTLQRLYETQKKLIKDTKLSTVVSIDQLKTAKKEYKIYKMALQAKAEIIRNLNRYMHERMMQLRVLELKRKAMIEQYAGAQVLDFRGKNEST